MTSDTHSAPSPPVGLAARGARFWRTVTATWLLDADETELLVETARQLDVCEALAAVVARDGVLSVGSTGATRAHPAVAELRAARLAVARLLAQLDLPSASGTTMPSARVVRARRAARARWGSGRDASTA